jgi:hypothetical protein
MEKFLKHMSVIIGTTIVGFSMLFCTNAARMQWQYLLVTWLKKS